MHCNNYYQYRSQRNAQYSSLCFLRIRDFMDAEAEGFRAINLRRDSEQVQRKALGFGPLYASSNVDISRH